LHKLIVKATADLEELDKKRREEFKQYEMEKEFQYQESLKNMSEPEKKDTIKKHDDQLSKHKQHARLHAPGSKQQLEEVWEEQDHMPKEEFNPKTFFSLRDVNGDGVLDQEEVESMLSLEVRKLYDPNNPEDDPNEMMEEYHRMREQIYKEADKDHDGLITRKEFLDLTARADFDKDPGWKGLDENTVYTQQELHEYEKHRQQALEHQYAYYVPEYHGAPPPHHGGPPPPPHHSGQFAPPPPPNHPPPVGYQQQGFAPQPLHPAYNGMPQQPQYAPYPNQPYPQQPYGQHPAYQQQPGYVQPQVGQNYPQNPQVPQLTAQANAPHHAPQQPPPQLQQQQGQHAQPSGISAQAQQAAPIPQYQAPAHINNAYPAQPNAPYQPPKAAYQQPPPAYQHPTNTGYQAPNPSLNNQNNQLPPVGQPVAQPSGIPPKP
jgi:Ca2+-binding EF-hand superfamily protein